MYKSATKVANCFLPNLSVETVVIYKHSMLYLQWEAGWKRFAGVDISGLLQVCRLLGK